jgi:hypothetical protein
MTGLSRRRSRVRVPSLPLKTSCKWAWFVVKAGGDDRRLFACPAQIPHDVESGLFAGIFIPSVPLYRSSIPRENSARPRHRGFAQFGTSPPRPTLLRTILEGLAERFLEERRVCGEAAGRYQLGELASLGPAKRDTRPPAQSPLEKQREIAPCARPTCIGRGGSPQLLGLTLRERDQRPDHIELYQQTRRMPDGSGRLPLWLCRASRRTRPPSQLRALASATKAVSPSPSRRRALQLSPRSRLSHT